MSASRDGPPLVPRAGASCEIERSRSRFLAELVPVASAERAREVLRETKARFPDATHVVHAFVVGPARSVLGSSDDGEPSGTAGRPVLDVLKGSGITNAILTVTRWFGGALLGTGGLVRAYGDAARACIALVDAEPLVETVRFEVDVSYEILEGARRVLSDAGAREVVENFGAEVSLSGLVPADAADGLSRRLTDLSRGRSIARLSR